MKRIVTRHTVVQPVDQSIKLIPLTRGYNAIIDAEDFSLVSQHNWFAIPSKKTENVYAGYIKHLPSGKNRIVLMHRFILQSECDIDHKNGNCLDNRRKNLRPCNDMQNGGNQKISKNNKSGYKGVFWHCATHKWSCNIYIKGKQIHIGLFAKDRAFDAARAYDRKAIELFGEFAHLNFPHSDYSNESLF
jgi:hypothetical protein